MPVSAEISIDVADTGRKTFLKQRNKFLALRDLRLDQFKRLLTPSHREIVELLPLLFHVNHPLLPGFVSTQTPCGIADYQADRQTLLTARKLTRSLTLKKRAKKEYPIRGLFLMGSIGSLGQSRQSDMDIWLCHSDNLSAQDLAELKQKADNIEQWAKGHRAALHIFLMHAESFKNGQVTAMSNESSGSIQHHSLLDEFYRSNVLLAGLPPLWWIVPPQEEKNYQIYAEKLIRQRFIRASNWLDFGGLENTQITEFFGAAFWQLHKAIYAPYKALLKLLLIETYVAEHPKVNWLSCELKKTLFELPSADADILDPYLLMLDKVSQYLKHRGETERLELVRRAFYFKTEQALSRASTRRSWKYRKMAKVVKSWGWSDSHIKEMDTRSTWKLEQVLAERNRLASELSRSYRLLTEYARQRTPMQGLDAEELALLGRKLYTSLERRPGKIDKINPNISGNIGESRLYIEQSKETQEGNWQLFKTEEPDRKPIKVTQNIIELLTWVIANNLIDADTLTQIKSQIQEPDYRYLLKKLKIAIGPNAFSAVPLEAFVNASVITCARIFINAESPKKDPVAEQDYQLTSHRDDPLSYGAQHRCLIKRLDAMSISSWGEIQVKHYQNGQAGLLNCICQTLDLTDKNLNKKRLPVEFIAPNSPRELAMAKRLNLLIKTIYRLFSNKEKQARFVFRVENNLYLINKKVSAEHEKLQWKKFTHEADLLEHLSKPLSQPTYTLIDNLAQTENPLAFLFNRYQENAIQVFYQRKKQHIAYYLLDEQGSLYFQTAPQTSEKHFLIQQQRFLHSLLTRQMVLSTADTELTEKLNNKVQFYRLEYGEKSWRAKKVNVPKQRPGDYLDLTLAAAAEDDWQENFSFILGDREFSSLMQGEHVYHELARHILSQRKNANSYPVFITQVINTGLEQQQHWPLKEVLNFKSTLEEKLSRALIQASDSC